jgi:alkaline phosphatase D
MELPPFVKNKGIAPRDLLSQSRRRFIRQFCSTAIAASAAAELAACRSTTDALSTQDHPVFLHGVASGDPLTDRVILWTRVTPGGRMEGRDVRVRWEVARDSKMRNIVATGFTLAQAQRDYTVKVDAAGLSPGTVYFYRFDTGSAYSPTGRTKTLPGDDATHVKLAVFSCSNYPSGYFNVYADALTQKGLDAALHIGDYIYEYESTGYGCAHALALGRVPEPRNATVVLDDYRRRYAQYRTDPDLQALHAALPWIAVWDDHEFADDAWHEGAVNHHPNTEGPFAKRKAAAIQAYHEWMPIRAPEPDNPEKIYRSFDFGRIASLHMLDTRMIGRDKQVAMSNFYDKSGEFDLERFRAEVASPERQMMGKEQLAWLETQVARSAASWQILGQQVLMARMEYPLPIIKGEVDCFEYVGLCKEAERRPASLNEEQQALVDAPTVPCYMDSWDGYAAERERVFDLMRRYDRNLVVLAGDSHNAWASDLHDDDGRQIGVEFATASVSSPGLECAYTEQKPEQVAGMMQDLIDPLYFAQTGKRGYMILSLTKKEARCDWRFVDTVMSRAHTAKTERSLRTLAGPQGRCIVEAT